MTAVPLWPVVEARSVDNNTARLTLSIPANLAWFEGHFDDMPVVPGVVQAHWAAHFAAEIFDTPKFSGNLRRLKFRRLLLPGTVVTLELNHDPIRNEVGFSLTSSAGEHASGKLLLVANHGD